MRDNLCISIAIGLKDFSICLKICLITIERGETSTAYCSVRGESSRFHQCLPLTHLSDHCCLHTSINTDFCIDIEDQHIPEQINLYQDRYKPDVAALKMLQRVLKANLSKNSSGSNLPLSTNDIATNLTNIITRSADVTVKRTKVKPKPRGSAPLGQPWYDNQCRAQKSKLNIAKKILHAKPLDQLSVSNYLSSRKAYKKFLKRAEQRHIAKLKEKLDSILTDNPRQY